MQAKKRTYEGHEQKRNIGLKIFEESRTAVEKYELVRRERLKSVLYLRLKKRKVFTIVKGGGHFRLFENPVCCEISKKNEGGPFGHIKIRKFFEKFRKK